MSARGRIFVAGATGFVGGALVARLLEAGWRVTALARDLDTAARGLGPDVALFASSDSTESLSATLSGCHAVVNLAGEPIVGRWSEAKKSRILGSRVETTRRLVEAIEDAATPPTALVSASAVGWYGHRTEFVDERAGPGSGFLSEVCQRWEAEASRACAHGTRVTTVRFGLVLGRGGGPLPPMLRAARFGLLGRLGTGDQHVAWIHLSDAVDLLVQAIDDPRFEGPVNAVTGSVPQRQFATAVARSVGRRLGPPVPAWAARVALGEAASLLLDSSPVRASEFWALPEGPTLPTLPDALAEVTARRGGSAEGR